MPCVIVNFLSHAWVVYFWHWLGENPHPGLGKASSGAAGAAVLFLIVLMIFSWLFLVYTGAYLKEAEEI